MAPKGKLSTVHSAMNFSLQKFAEILVNWFFTSSSDNEVDDALSFVEG